MFFPTTIAPPATYGGARVALSAARLVGGGEDGAHERRLPDAVRPDDADALSRGHDEIEGSVEGRRARRRRHLEAPKLEDCLALLLGRRGDEGDLAGPSGRRRTARLELVGPLDARLLLGAAGLGSPREPLALAPEDVLAVLLDALFVGHELGLPGEVVAVAAAVRHEPPALDLDDALHDRVEEVPIVRHEHDRAGEVLRQEALRARPRYRRRGGWSARRGSRCRGSRRGAARERCGVARRRCARRTADRPRARRADRESPAPRAPAPTRRGA